MPTVAPPSSTARRADLDWLRVAMFGGLIFYHLGLLYEAGRPAVSVALLATHPWRMSMLFFISGAATRFMDERLTRRALPVERSVRLLLPLAFGVLVLVPLQAYFALRDGTAYAGDYFSFLQTYFDPSGRAAVARDLSVRLPVYGHLWFVFYLWVYTLVLAAALAMAPGWFAWTERLVERHLKGPGLFFWPLAVLVLLRLCAFPAFGLTLAFADDWYNHLVSAGMFLLGFLTARSDVVWARLARARWSGLILGLAGLAFYVGVGLGYGVLPEAAEIAHPALSVFYDLERWGAMIALLGFAHHHLAGRAPAPRYLNGGIFTAYLVHQPVMAAVRHWLAPLDLQTPVEMALVGAGAVAGCVLAYEAARRSVWLGVALGQRPIRVRWARRAAPAASDLITAHPRESGDPVLSSVG